LSLALSQPALGAGERVAEKGPAARASAGSSQEASTMNIRLTINGKTITASLNDNATARDFLALLPLTLTLEDYAATEKIAYLPRKLSTAGAPAGFDPSIGDITYYAPWGNLAIFYQDFGYSEGLVNLGRIDSGIEALNVRGSLKVTNEPVGRRTASDCGGRRPEGRPVPRE
jgi:hypothetical protein